MAKPNLPVNIDTTYGDDTDPSVKVHQQHHDAVHGVVNLFDPAGTPQSGWEWAWDATAGAFQMRAPLTSSGSSAAGVSILEFGTPANDSSGANHTTLIQGALDALAPSGTPLLLEPRTYAVENLVIPARVIMGQPFGTTARFGTINQPTGGGTRSGTVQIRRAGAYTGNTSTAPMITVLGSGGGLQGVTLAGQGAPGTILEMTGYESTLSDVRVIGGGGIGIDVQRSNNSQWYNIYIDNCGSSTLPAMKIWSKTGVAGAAETNTMDIYGLTIERALNMSLDIAYDPNGGAVDGTQYWAEFIRLIGMHVESSYLDTQNVGPAIRIGNVRALDMIAPFLYAGSSTGPVIQHARQFARSSAGGNGGVRLIGGEILGPDPSAPAPNNAMPYAVDLVTGDAFSIIGTRMLRWATAAVRAQSTFGQSLSIDTAAAVQSIVRNTGNTANLPILEDNRATTTRVNVPLVGDHEFRDGHLMARQVTAPTLSNATGVTGAALATPSTDVAGSLTFGTGTTPPVANAAVQTITFNRPFPNIPRIILQPTNAATAGAGNFFVGPVGATGAWTGMTIYTSAALAASQAAGTYSLYYHVIG